MAITTTLRLIWQLTPVAVRTAVLNLLRLSQNAKKQDLKTEVIVAVLKKLTSVPQPIGSVQKWGLRDPGIKGPIWISTVTMPAPAESDTLDVLLRAIEAMGDGTEQFTKPTVASIEAEWTGARHGVGKNEPRPDLPEAEQYNKLLNESPGKTTILYFHGGAYLMMDPATHRVTTGKLSKRTGGRVLSVRYRLAPQFPFPAALLDAFLAYLYLISPPPGSFHDPVKPSHIVFAGDSAGGGLSTALLLLLLHLRRSGVTHVQIHGKSVELGIPAGIATNSPWLDVTHALPSMQRNKQYDYLQLPNPDGTPTTEPPRDDIWPASPPRAEIYCNASMLTHPLVSPAAASAELWKGTPPVFMVCGEELLTDGATAAARQIHGVGGVVHFVGYEGMPHCFSMIFQTEDCFSRWAQFCMDAATDPKLLGRPNTGTWVRALTNPPEGYESELASINALSGEEVRRLMTVAKAKAVIREEELVKKWEQKETRAKL
ncbi:uncharacterized protein HMPREF1541_01345 [Cyphellophora europaea CBS 101466]|uniref:Alpha/beta hydrolase fold-3 domain-containing protein n=1 Tax=Cyphellophora europaea (strain CBS 101466) TaxID=1220924 RepID=W2SH02_CYPE1|nr:uncharacterized protein HMPREF1541_01345 [Cyphellophora europaea CBS 101466]ETN47154.1 hypothetical protein HMPREF1541_01345 [Cyphellophora europaea CBS 101466]